MSAAGTNGSTPSNVPPDPGGRSRFLIRGIVIACAVLAVLAVLLLLALRRAAPPGAPTQQQPNSGSVRLAIHEGVC